MIRLTLPYPPSGNNYKKPRRDGPGMYVTKKARAFRAAVHLAARAAKARPYDGDVLVELRIYRPRRQGDLDNVQKVLLDALQGFAYLNDSQVAELHAYRLEDAKRPRAEVCVWNSDEERE